LELFLEYFFANHQNNLIFRKKRPSSLQEEGLKTMKKTCGGKTILNGDL